MALNHHINISSNNSMDFSPRISPRLSAIHINSNSSNGIKDVNMTPMEPLCNDNEHKEEALDVDLSSSKRPPVTLQSSNIPRIGSGKSLSSISSISSCTSNRTKEIYENVNDEHIQINHLHISITPPAISPNNNNNNDNDNDNDCDEPMISALASLYTTKYETNVREVDVSPHSNMRNMEHQDLKQHNVNIAKHGQTQTQWPKSLTSTIWSSLKRNVLRSNDNDDESKYDNAQNEESISIIQNEEFMDNAIEMYGHLDDALSNINALKMKKMQSLKDEKQNKKAATDDTDKRSVNDEVIKAMKTLLSSTTKMSGFFMSNQSNDDKESGSSLIGRSLDKLSSSIAYMSYISMSRVTPFIYNMVEAVLLELYATIKDIIEYYDSDPKNNILYRLISKMNEIIEAIHGLLALSECFYEINSDDHDDNNDDDQNDDEASSYSLFNMHKKVKKD